MKFKKIVVVVLSLYTLGMLLWWMSLPAGTVVVRIPPGAGTVDIARILARERVIASPVLFRVAVRLSGTATRLKAGSYSLAPRSSIFTVLKALSEGRANFVKVTIPEGFTAKQIAGLLASRRVVDEARFLAIVEQEKLEGYLFPDTYFFEKGMTEREVADRMKAELRKYLTPEASARMQALKMTEHQVLTLASIIEKEAYLASERPVIAGVFYNRLKRRMPLQSCATVQYVLGHRPRLSYEDVRVESPYNTYRHPGLPPGPICSPGAASLQAALNPATTDALFFVATSSGAHSFSRYYAEHLMKQRKNGK